MKKTIRNITYMMMIAILFVSVFTLKTEFANAADIETTMKITIKMNIPDDSYPMNIQMYFTNRDTNKQYYVECSADQNYEYYLSAPAGTYTLSSYAVYNIANDPPLLLDYVITFPDFAVTPADNDKVYSGDMMERALYEAINGTTEEETTEGHTGDSASNVADPMQTTNEQEIAYYTIPEDNAYFPGWTIIEIQSWYKDAVATFLQTDFAIQMEEEYLGGNSPLTNKMPEYYYEGVNNWTSRAASSYSSLQETALLNRVERYNAEETQDFYQVQKKIYDFIADYYKQTGLQLNFSIWNYTSIADPGITAEHQEEVTETTGDNVEQEVIEETENENEEAAEEVEVEETEQGFNYSVLIVIVIVLLVLAIIALLLVKMNKAKENN